MDHRLRLCHVVLIVAMLLSMAPTGATRQLAAAPVTAEIEPELETQIRAEGSAGYLIYFREAPDLTPATKLDWQARGRYVVAALQETADRSQKGVRAYLEARGVPYRSFWIDNVIVVERSDLSTANTLATSFPEIAALRARRAPILHEPMGVRPSATLMAIESNLQHVLADQVWDMGYTGQGIVVANIDSGVRYTHDALVNPYRGNLGGGSFDHNHNWWDPYLGTTAPSDSQNHGSHTMGTMVGDDGGDNRIGMAPGAQWIACKSFEGGDVDAQLLECGQFMAAPWDLTGANADPDLRPHIVNNSWGDCGQVYDDWYDGVLTAWHAAGIYPVFSNGNASNCGYSSPPGLNTVGNPARAGNVTGVGATGTSDGQYAIYSAWGPTDDPDTVNPRGYPQLKPQVVAPGTNRSAYGTGTDATYGGMSGTSMAAPHVAGLVALMWSAAPCLVGDYATTETIIEETATPIPYATGGSPAPGPGNVPNYATGWGEIDALAAVEAAIASCGGGTLMGAVTDGATLEPIAGAQVRASALLTETRSTLTDPNGLYNLAVYPGTYTVTVASYGYQVEVVPDVQVSAGLTTTLDVPLTAATWYTVSGSVTDAETGWPLYAEIDIDGYPGAPIRTDPVTGAYSISLPGGRAYTFGVTAWVAGYTAASIPVGPLTDDAPVDVDLDPDRAFCRAPGYQMDYVYEEDFEASDGGYTPGGTPADEWQWGPPTAWPSGCASGEACWGTNLTGNYSDSADTTLISPVIDLSGASAPLTARWWQALHIESAAYDHAYAEVSTNGGAWQTMWSHTGGTTQIDWAGMSYDLSAAAGGNVQFRFRLTSDSSVAYAGYYIDLVTISRGADCHAPADGGLVVGNVYDVETGDPLVGARVENEAGELMLTQATPADAAVDDGFYTLFAPSGPQVFTATLAPYAPQTETVMVEEGGTVRQDFDLQWLRPRVATVPVALDVTVELGAQLTETLEILNTGTAATDFEISERDRGFQPTAGEDVLVVAYDTTAAAAMEAALDAHGRTYLRVTRDAFQATAVGDLLAYGAVLYAGSVSGDGWAKAMAYLDAGGALYISDNDLGYSNSTTVFYQTYLQATYDVDDAGDYLTGEGLMAGLDPDISADPYPDGFSVGSEGTRIFKYTASGYAGGVAVERGNYRAVYTSFDFDDVAGAEDRIALMERVLGFLTSFDVPWFSVDPMTGTLAADIGSALTNVAFDAAMVDTPGRYLADLWVASDDPSSPYIVPVTMTVTAPDDWGKLEGTVTGLGPCDADPVPLEDAEVHIESSTGMTRTLMTDAAGWYSLWLPASHGPLSVAVAVEAHEPGLAEGVPLVEGGVTTVDFDLRRLQPCGAVSPESLSVELVLGQEETLELTLSNVGAADMDFQFREITATRTVSGTYRPSDTVATARSSRTPMQTESGTPDGKPVAGIASGAPRPQDVGDAWEVMAPLPEGRVFSAVIADPEGYVYVMGGTSDAGATSPTATNYRYDTADDTWTVLAPLPAALDSIDGAFIDGRIYIPGGATTADTYVYDIATDSWSTIAANGGYTARSQYQVVVIDTDLVVLGGIVAAAGASTTEVWVLDTTAGTWSAGVPMQKSRTSFSAASIDGVIYVAGGVLFPGFIPDMTAEKFDGVGWSYIASLPDGGGAYTRWSYNADGLGRDGLWLAGGRRDAGWAVLDHAGYYDPQTDSWTDSPTIPTLNQGRVYMEGDVASDGYFYVIGGRDSAGATIYSTNERLYVGYAGGSPTDIPWITEEPSSGTVPADDGVVVVDVTFTALPTMTVGVHTATLVVRTNDPQRRSFTVPVTMTIVPEYTLTMAAVGNGAVEPALGDHVYRDGRVVPITATADIGWMFVGWQGAVADPSAARTTVTMDADQVVTATFVALHTLDVTIVGEGDVTVDPEQATYVYGDVVTLTATADPGWTFVGWSGDATGTDDVTTVTIAGDAVVTATFIRLPDLYVSKTVAPTVGVELGEVVTYTIELVNRGDATAMGIVLTDTLPAGVVFDAFVANAGAAEEDAGVITWSGGLAKDETLTITFTATVEEDEALYNTTITNAVEFTSDNAGSGADEASFAMKRLYRVILPVVMKTATP